MKAIIPVAGVGTRLRPHTHSAPKVLLPVCGKPMLGHILDELMSLGFNEITFIIGYMGDMIQEYVTSHYSFKANFVEQREIKGLGHAISLAKPHHNTDDEPVLIVLGDTIFRADLKSVFEKSGSQLGVKQVEDARRFGIVQLDEKGSVTRLIEKPDNPPTNLAIAGIYWIEKPATLFECLDELIREGKTTKNEFQLTDALQKYLDRGQKMEVFEVEGWYDCGKAETLLETNRDLLEMYGGNADKMKARYADSIIIPPVVIADDVKISRSVIGPHVSVSANASILNSVLSNTIVGENVEINNTVLADSILGDEARVTGQQVRLNIGHSSEALLH